MMAIHHIAGFFPEQIRKNVVFHKYMLKEYIQLLVLDYLSTTHYIRKITFIGGTNLRLIKGIDRFSEDLDFDCKGMSSDEFMAMSDDVVLFLHRSGFDVQTKDKKNDKLTAFRRNLLFPEMLFKMGLSGHKEERFLIKMEAQDQLVEYDPVMVNIKGCGLFFPFPVPPDSVLCAMKLAAMLSRAKGRDFYDAVFLLSQTQPDYRFLEQRCGISNLTELKNAVMELLKRSDLKKKQKDFEHLIFNRENSRRILKVGAFFDVLS